MHEHSSNSDLQGQNASVAQDTGTGGKLRLLADEHNFDLEEVGQRDVAIERNADQTFVYVETESASIVAALDVSELTLAEVIEQVDQIGDPFEYLARGPVFAADGGEQ